MIDVAFTGRVVEWRGPAPYYFVPVPEEESADIDEVKSMVTYGWGVIPVRVSIGDTDFTTSLFPKDGRYLVPLKDKVRHAERLDEGDDVEVRMTVGG